MSARSPRPAAPRRSFPWAGSALFLLLAAGLLLPACRREQTADLRKHTRLLMNTYVTIQAYGPARKTDRAIEAAFLRLEEINRKFNHLDSTSPVYAFNARNEALVDSEVVEVVKAAVRVSEASGGAFDVTVQPLVRLWGFYDDRRAVPSHHDIDSCLRLVGYRNLGIEPGRVTKLNPGTTIDLGGIAKGYALSEVARVLKDEGVDSALIDAGGDVYGIGKRKAQNWRVGVRNPRGEGIVGVVAVSNLAVVTSGDYERYFFGPDSVRYCHIIDPRTGWPAHGLISTTVMMRDPVAAQGWAKVLFVLGPDAMRFAEEAGGFEALLITDGMKAITTRGLAGALDLKLTEAGMDTASGR